jgi:hypothetical protein
MEARAVYMLFLLISCKFKACCFLDIVAAEELSTVSHYRLPEVGVPSPSKIFKRT